MEQESNSSDEREILERCQRRYPTIDLPAEEFLCRARQTGIAFEQLHHEDLFLATACSRGNRIAWEHFTDEFLPLLKGFAAQACRNLGESEDLAHDLLGVLIGDSKKMASYDGRGSLASWLRVAVARAAIDRFRRTRREESLEEAIEEGREPPATTSTKGFQTEALDARWGSVLSTTLKEEIEILPPRDRLLLSLYYLEEVPLKTIGLHFGVHEATVSRWLDKIRSGIRRGVERKLRRYRLRPGEIASIWKSIAEEGKLSLKEIL
jgi:RNA polymerase sigma-70 factor (ECF subfamily)